MSDRSIPFTAPEVRALLAGTKTQTRRILTPQGSRVWQERGPCGDLYWKTDVRHKFGPTTAVRRLYEVGDRLWVREAWRTGFSWDDTPPRDIPAGSSVSYETGGYRMSGRLRASMHMPRWASRLTLIITDVRVQRLQDILIREAVAEGLMREERPSTAYIENSLGERTPLAKYEFAGAPGLPFRSDPRKAYSDLWNHINGPGAWDANPWVAGYTFTVHQQNIDQMQDQSP